MSTKINRRSRADSACDGSMRPNICAMKQISPRTWKPPPLKMTPAYSLQRSVTSHGRVECPSLRAKRGISREALYRSLSAEGNPELSTLT